jgi:hypothetical protein
MKSPGNILPTRESLAIGDAVHAKNVADNAAYAAKHLSHCERRVVGTEARFYRNDTQYATLADHRNQQVRWFETRADGDYSIKAPE